MVKLRIGQRVLIHVLLVGLIPLILVNLLWFNQSQKTLSKNAADKQRLLVEASADQVDHFVREKINSLIIYAQTSSLQQFEPAGSRENLEALLKQDSAIVEAALVDNKGNERLVVNQADQPRALRNVSSSDAFKVTTFVSGKEYIGPVAYSDDSKPFIIMAVPLLKFVEAQSSTNLSTAESGIVRTAGDIKGSLIITVGLQNLWQSVLSAKLGEEGYAYLVDDKGNLIAHPDPAFASGSLEVRQIEAVQAFLTNAPQQAQETTSEKGIQVLSSYAKIDRTNWAVIAQEPIGSVYASISQAVQFAAALFLGVLLLVVILSLLFSRQLVKPIEQLKEGATLIGQGQFEHQISLTTKDELGALAEAFNQMGASLNDYIHRFKLENVKVTAERNKLAVVLDSISDGVLAVDSEGRIMLANLAASKLLGRSPGDVIGLPLDQTFPWRKEGQTVSLKNTVPGLTFLPELTLTGPDNRKHYLDLLVAKILGDPGGIDSIITIQDQTKGRELEAMKVDFVSLAAHELRTPLTAIKGYLDLISRSHGNTLNKQYLDRSRISAEQLEGLVNNLLSVSRIERGALNLNMHKIDWGQIIRDMLQDFQMATKEKKLTLSGDVADSKLEVIGDELALREVAGNLINNAIHYTEPGGHITVTAKLDGDQAVTTVTDTGHGISATAVPNLFTKFYRAQNPTDSGSAGTGLGLFISKSIIEMHKGKIWVDSKEGVGSTFGFSLPVFSQELYDQLQHTSNLGVGRSHGWIKKSTVS